MGKFISISGIVDKTMEQVISSLKNFAETSNGTLEPLQLDPFAKETCLISQSEGNTTILYPDSFNEWNHASVFISRELRCPVFSFHIHDDDFWMYWLYDRGMLIDKFNPIPDYWNSNISSNSMAELGGNPALIANLLPNIYEEDISNYLVRWNQDSESYKAYPQDEYEYEAWQMTDFMKRLGFLYPLQDSQITPGQTFRLFSRSA